MLAVSFSQVVAEEPQSSLSSLVINERGTRGGKHGTRTRVSVGRMGWLGRFALRWPRQSRPSKDYVIGGMDRGFKARLYRLFRALDDAGLAPGMTSGFRDDYRQSIASGNKAATDSSYHGGSRRGGYGHGLAADVVSVKGATRSERWLSTEILWNWIDAHGKEFGIGRPYLDKDPPHIAPIDGKEYVAKRGVNAKTKHAGL